METTPIADRPVSAKENHPRPYPASWVDRFTDWVNRLPVPAWVFYLCLWFFLIILISGSKWLDGVEPSFMVRWIYALYAFYGVYFLAAISYLDTWAKDAFATFRPVLAVEEEEQAALLYQLTTMPARPVWLLTAVMLVIQIFLVQPLIIPLWVTMGFPHNSIAATLVDLGLYTFNAIMVGVFIYHTLRQLSWISRIHKAATRVNLFQIRPLYTLSGLTARTAGVLILVGLIIEQQTVSHGVLTSDPYALRMSGLFTLTSILVYSLLAVAVFFLPLLGLHNLLIREQERLQSEADTRLQAQIEELHQRIDSHQLEDADAINKHLASLALEREILSRLPTWPWQPGTPNLILTTVLLPIILWIIQQLLERWGVFQ